MPKTVVAAYQTRTDALQKATAYYVRAYVLTGGIPSGTERAFSRDFATGPLQAQTGTKLISLDAPQGNVQTVFPEQGQSSIGSFTFPLYDRDGEITRQIGNPKKGLLAAITATVPATGGNLDANGPVDGYPAKGAGKIDDEIFLYASLDTANNRFVNITRGAHGTTAAAHALGATIHNFEQLRLGNRLQLFAGYTDLNEADFMSFAKMEVVDIRLRQDLSTYEIVCADVQRFTRARIFTGATPDAAVTKTGNPVTLALQVLLTSTTAGKNHVTYDLGDGNGLDLHPALVDVAGLESLRDTEFAGNVYSFTIREPQDAKAWLEREIWQTLNCVPFITQDGKYSAKRLKNAGATVGSITKDHVVRVVGWREATDRVINVLDFRYDFDLDGNPNAFGKRRIYLMDNSIADFGRRPALVLESRGIKSANGGDTIANNRALRISDRWASPPPALVLDLFYEKHLFDIGDQVSVTLPEVPDLKGVRSLTSEVFEVLDIRPLFDPVGQAGMQVTMLWLGSVVLPPAPTSTTATPGTLERDRTAPAVPTGLALTTGSDVLVDGTFEALISATWTGNTESDLEGYRLRIKKTSDGASAWSTFTMGKAVAGIIVRGLQPNTAYEAQVSAFDFWGNESAFSASASATTPGSPGAPAIPTGLAATARTLSILLTWNANPELDIANYEVQRADDTGFLTNVILRRVDALLFVETPGDTTTRHYRIRATRRSGSQSAFTTHVSIGALAVSAGDLEAAAPATPTALTLTTDTQLDPGDGTVKPFLNLAWNANAESDLANYQVDYRRQGDTPFSSQLVRKEILSARYYGVVGNVIYEARIAAIDRLGNASAFTALSTITTAKDTTAPAVPTAVTATGFFKQVLIRFTPSADVDREAVEVWASQTNDSATATKKGETGPDGVSFIHGGLGNAETWYHWLKSRDTSKNVSGFHATQFAGVSGTTLKIGGADVLTTEAIITVSAQIANAIINNAHIADLSADKITAGLIDVLVRLGVNNIELDGVNSVITIKDTQGVPVTRVKIGKMGAGSTDWGIQIKKADGTLMYDFTTGVEDAGLKFQKRPFGGNGSDGALTVPSGTTVVNGLRQHTNLTIQTGGTLTHDPLRALILLVQDTLTLQGTGTISGVGKGGIVAGSARTVSLGGSGGAGGSGGGGGGGGGGSGGSGGGGDFGGAGGTSKSSSTISAIMLLDTSSIAGISGVGGGSGGGTSISSDPGKFGSAGATGGGGNGGISAPAHQPDLNLADQAIFLPGAAGSPGGDTGGSSGGAGGTAGAGPGVGGAGGSTSGGSGGGGGGASAGSGGGSGGNGGNGGASGLAGKGGGLIYVEAKTVSADAGGSTITCNGEGGSNGSGGTSGSVGANGTGTIGGGGGGGAGGGGDGGGGGGGGGCCSVFARSFTGGTTTITASGGAGGSAGAGAAGGNGGQAANGAAAGTGGAVCANGTNGGQSGDGLAGGGGGGGGGCAGGNGAGAGAGLATKVTL